MKIVDSKTDHNLAMILHLCGFLNGMLPIVVPLIIWLLKREESDFIDKHGKAALNFQISVIIISILAVLFIIFTFGLGTFFVAPLAIIFVLLYILFIIRAAIAAHKGQYYTYPISWDIIK